jgi:hypothetical protein
MNRRRVDVLDVALGERARRWRSFDQCHDRPAYEPLGTMKYSLSKISLEMAAKRTGPSFLYNLYVHPVRLLQARNVVWSILAHLKSNPFAPHVNIVECAALEEAEWVFEPNWAVEESERTGSCL